MYNSRNENLVCTNPKAIAFNSFLGAFSGLFIIWFLILTYNSHTVYLQNCLGLSVRVFCFYLFTVFIVQSSLGSFFSALKNISILLVYGRMALIILLAILVWLLFSHTPDTFNNMNLSEFFYGFLAFIIFTVLIIERMSALSYHNPIKDTFQETKTIANITSCFYLGVILAFIVASIFFNYFAFTSAFIFSIIITFIAFLNSLICLNAETRDIFRSPFKLVRERSSLNETIFAQFNKLKKHNFRPSNIILCSISYALTLLVALNLIFLEQSTAIYFNISFIIILFGCFLLGFIFVTTFIPCLIKKKKKKHHFLDIMLAAIFGVICCLIIGLMTVNLPHNSIDISGVKVDYSIISMTNCFFAGLFMSLIHNPLYYRFYENIKKTNLFFHAVSLYLAIRAAISLVCVIVIVPFHVYPFLSEHALTDELLSSNTFKDIENFNTMRVVISLLCLISFALYLVIKKLVKKSGNKEWKNF